MYKEEKKWFYRIVLKLQIDTDRFEHYTKDLKCTLTRNLFWKSLKFISKRQIIWLNGNECHTN